MFKKNQKSVTVLSLGLALSILGGGSTGWCDESPIILKFKEKDILLGQGKIELNKLTSDDLSIAPKRWYRGGIIPQPEAVAFFWGNPVFMDQQRDEWGTPIVTDPVNEPNTTILWAWSRMLGLHAANWAASPNGSDVFGAPTMSGTGYFGPVASTKIKGDPTGLSNDETTFQVSAPGTTPKVQYNFSSVGATTKVVDGDWNLEWKWMNNTLFFLTCGETSFGYAKGTYKGKPVEMLGAYDRYYFAIPSVFWLFDKRMMAPFAAKGADGKFEYGMVFIFKNFLWNNKFIAGGFYCKDGEGCVATTDLKVKNVTWQKDPKSRYILPTEGTWIVGDKEVYIKAKGGFNLKNIKSNNWLVNLMPILTIPLKWADATAVWKESHSQAFDLSFAALETTEFTDNDIAELKSLEVK